MRRAALLFVITGVLAVLALSPTLAGARTAGRSCGKVAGTQVHAHGVGCPTARRVYKADMSGGLPRGWTCSAALGRCYRGEVGRSSEYIWWRPTSYRLERERIVLGVIYGAPRGAANSV